MRTVDFIERCENSRLSGVVQAIDNNPLNPFKFITGSSDGTVKVWQFEAQNEKGDKDKYKKVKSEIRAITPLDSKTIHADEISNLLWIDTESILTASHDHMIKLYDI